MNGGAITLLFAMPACEYFQKKILDGSVIIDDDGNTVGSSSLAFLCYAGYWNYCIANGRPPKKTISDFLNWVEDNMEDESAQADLLSVAECFRDSKSVVKFKERNEKQVEEAKKKISTGNQLNHSAMDSLESDQQNTGE